MNKHLYGTGYKSSDAVPSLLNAPNIQTALIWLRNNGELLDGRKIKSMSDEDLHETLWIETQSGIKHYYYGKG